MSWLGWSSSRVWSRRVLALVWPSAVRCALPRAGAVRGTSRRPRCGSPVPGRAGPGAHPLVLVLRPPDTVTARGGRDVTAAAPLATLVLMHTTGGSARTTVQVLPHEMRRHLAPRGDPRGREPGLCTSPVPQGRGFETRRRHQAAGPLFYGYSQNATNFFGRRRCGGGRPAASPCVVAQVLAAGVCEGSTTDRGAGARVPGGIYIVPTRWAGWCSGWCSQPPGLREAVRTSGHASAPPEGPLRGAGSLCFRKKKKPSRSPASTLLPTFPPSAVARSPGRLYDRRGHDTLVDRSRRPVLRARRRRVALGRPPAAPRPESWDAVVGRWRDDAGPVVGPVEW